MVAAMIQLETKGLQDAYLTATPKIDFFKYNYYQYVNFATELVKVPLDDVIDFGKSSSCLIPKIGHLLSNLYLRIKVPALTKTSGTYLSWSETLGYAIFKDGVDLEIGGIVMDTFYPGFWDIRESFVKPDNDLGANLLLLRGDTYVSSRHNAERVNDMIIPLKFWFTREYKMSLPIIAMRNQDIRLKFKFRSFLDCINYDGSEPADNVHMIDAEVFAEYIYLDDSVLDNFANKEHEFLIEQVRYNGDDLITQGKKFHNAVIEFNNPCKEVMFGCVEKANIVNNNYYNYSAISTDSNIVSRITFSLDGRKRFEEVFNRLAYANSIHSSVPLKYVYSVPFCIKPEDNQPTGAINLARFDHVVLGLELADNNPESFVFVYGVMYNIVVISGGFLKLRFNL
jgi:hypothetical protein